jgi:hypothetical protein
MSGSPAVFPAGSAGRLVVDLETVLRQMTEEYRKLLKHVEAQHAAMKTLDSVRMDEATNLQESSRLRLATMEHRRRTLVLQIARMLRIGGEPKIPALAAHFPQRRATLLAARDQLQAAMKEVATRNHIAGRLAGAVLGHLNTAVRLFAGAMDSGGMYTKQGMPRVANRIGRLEAVG